MTSKYEAALVFSVAGGDDSIAALNTKFNELIAKHGTVENVDDWGKRRLAYPINKETDAFYVLFNFKSEAELPAELDRVAKITDGVLRSMIVKKEA